MTETVTAAETQTDYDWPAYILRLRDGAIRLDAEINDPFRPPLGELTGDDPQTRTRRQVAGICLARMIRDDLLVPAPAIWEAHYALQSAERLEKGEDIAPHTAERVTRLIDKLLDTANDLAPQHGVAVWSPDDRAFLTHRRLTEYLIEEVAEARATLRRDIAERAGLTDAETDGAADLTEAWIDRAWARALMSW